MTNPDPPMPVDARHQVLFRLVGQIITHWSHVEWQLFTLFASITRTDINRARIVLAGQQNFRAKRELIERLGRAYLHIDLIDPFERIMARVKHLSEKRNMVAHHRAYYLKKERVWRFMNDSDETQPNTFGRYQDVQTGNLRSWVREIAQLNSDLMTLFAALLRRGKDGIRNQPREFGELERDRGSWGGLAPNDGEAPQPPAELSPT